MSPTATNVVTMPKPSNSNSSDAAHRSTARASAPDKPASTQNEGSLSAAADKSVRPTQAEPPTEVFAVFGVDRKSTRLNSSHSGESRMPSSA